MHSKYDMNGLGNTICTDAAIQCCLISVQNNIDSGTQQYAKGRSINHKENTTPRRQRPI